MQVIIETVLLVLFILFTVGTVIAVMAYRERLQHQEQWDAEDRSMMRIVVVGAALSGVGLFVMLFPPAA